MYQICPVTALIRPEAPVSVHTDRASALLWLRLHGADLGDSWCICDSGTGAILDVPSCAGETMVCQADAYNRELLGTDHRKAARRSMEEHRSRGGRLGDGGRWRARRMEQLEREMCRTWDGVLP